MARAPDSHVLRSDWRIAAALIQDATGQRTAATVPPEESSRSAREAVACEPRR